MIIWEGLRSIGLMILRGMGLITMLRELLIIVIRYKIIVLGLDEMIDWMIVIDIIMGIQVIMVIITISSRMWVCSIHSGGRIIVKEIVLMRRGMIELIRIIKSVLKRIK